MKRREFFLAAGMGTAAVVAGRARPAGAAGKTAEKQKQVYKCKRCGAVVEIEVPGSPTLVHCGVPMTLLEEQTKGDLAPKHVPIIEAVAGGYLVKVGAVTHPMTKSHHIVWIDLIGDGVVQRAYLKPDGKPQATFQTKAKKVCARAYCNLHDLWMGKA